MQKKIVRVGFALYFNVFFTVFAHADVCTSSSPGAKVNAAGDISCPDSHDPRINYEVDSPATAASKASALSASLTARQSARQQADLNALAEAELIANQIANDPKLEAQQEAINKSLSSLNAQKQS